MLAGSGETNPRDKKGHDETGEVSSLRADND